MAALGKLKSARIFALKYWGEREILDEILKLRQAVARALRTKICGDEASAAKPTAAQFTVFFAEELKAIGNASGTNRSVFGYSRARAESALNTILDEKPYWTANINENKAKFEAGLTSYINKECFPGLGRIPLGFFRNGFDGQIARYAEPVMLTDERHDEFIVSQLFDQCKASGGKLDSIQLRGLFIVAAIRIEQSGNPLGTSKVTFADLFDGDIVPDRAKIDFGACHVESMTRINPAGKPTMSEAEYHAHISSVYAWTDGDVDQKTAKKQLLEKCIRLMVKTTQKYLVPLDKLLNKEIGCGRLPRVMLDVEKGVMVARRADQGAIWILGISSIEDHVDECVKLFDKSIAGTYLSELKRKRSGKG